MRNSVAFLIRVLVLGLLLAGGLMGLIKAGSKISLITSAIFALLLAFCGFSGHNMRRKTFPGR